MAEAHYHLVDNTSVIEVDDESGIQAMAARVQVRMEQGDMIVVPGFADKRVDLIMVNPDHIVKIMFVSD